MLELKIMDLRTVSQTEYEQAFLTLSKNRRAKIEQKKQKRDRIASVMGEYLALEMAKKLCGDGGETIEVARTEHGKPYFVNAALFLSITHAKDKVGVAVSDRPVGLDMEYPRPLKFRTIKKACCDQELQGLWQEKEFNPQALVEDREVLESFYRLWTKKEAYGKLIGTGLQAGLSFNTCDETLLDQYEQRTWKEDGYILSCFVEK